MDIGGLGWGNIRGPERRVGGSRWEGGALFLPLLLLFLTPWPRALPRGQLLSLASRGWS